MAMPEKNLSHIKPLILKGKITVFGQLFDHVSVGEVAEAMGCGVKQVEAVRRDCGRLKLKQLWALSEAIGLSRDRVSDLFVE
jgi:hypothetical protein